MQTTLRRPDRDRFLRAMLLALAAAPWILGTRPAFATDMTPRNAEAQSLRDLEFRLLTEIPLPGPLPAPGPSMQGESIRIPVAGGVAVSGWSSETTPLLLPSHPADLRPPPQSAWVLDPLGKNRFRALPNGWIEAQSICHACEQGWRPRFKLRVAGSTFAAPLVTRHRVYFGSMDNRVYAINRRNGHRLWATDVGNRVTRPLVLLEGVQPDSPPADGRRPRRSPRSVALLLSVPDGGTELLALEAATGAVVATFSVPQTEDRLVGAPVVTPDRRIVVARQKYVAGEASLMVLELSSRVGDGDLSYNAPHLPAAVAGASAPRGRVDPRSESAIAGW